MTQVAWLHVRVLCQAAVLLACHRSVRCCLHRILVADAIHGNCVTCCPVTQADCATGLLWCQQADTGNKATAALLW